MRGKGWRIRDQGNVADLLVTGIFMLAMTVLLLSFMDSIALIQRKTEVSQLARKYILRMETTGGLGDGDKRSLLQELEEQGVTGADLSGTTFGAAGYGEPISLEIKGKLGGRYEFEEKRVSTAKY